MQDHCLSGSKGDKNHSSTLREFLKKNKNQSSQLMRKIADKCNASKEKN